jgi:hypothetical protein
MTTTLLADVNNQVTKLWSPLFVPELLESSVLPALCNKEYEGQIQETGDTVYVSSISRPTAQRRQTGADESVFTAQKLATQRVALVADQVFSTAFKFSDLVKFQSQIGQKDSEIRKVMLEAILIEINNFLYSKVAPSSSAPDHTTTGVSDFNAAALLAARLQASSAKWPENSRYMLVDPSYMNDLLTAQTLNSSDYVGEDAPTVNGKMLKQRFGFWIVEDNSSGMSQISPAANTSDLALGLVPDWLLLALSQAEFKVSDLHPLGQFGYQISCRVIGGAALNIEGAKKHLTVVNT